MLSDPFSWIRKGFVERKAEKVWQVADCKAVQVGYVLRSNIKEIVMILPAYRG